MSNPPIYEEKISSPRTEALFLFLTLLFLALFAWRAVTSGPGPLAIVFFVFFAFFLFYSLNYRTLTIRLTAERLRLGFGIFTWTVPLEAIQDCCLDDVSLWRIGGAGIHFTSIGRRYRAMFNFLEHERVLIRLKEKRGPVWDIAFSTREPQKIIHTIRQIRSLA